MQVGFRCLSCGSTKIIATSEQPYLLNRRAAAAFLGMCPNSFRHYVEPELVPVIGAGTRFKTSDLVEWAGRHQHRKRSVEEVVQAAIDPGAKY